MLRDGLLATPARRWLLTEPDFVIVGTGRSGTRYISQLLRAAGVKCGHENWWSLKFEPTTRLQGDASWIATFQVTGFEGHVFHQIRDPLKVITSLVRGRPELVPGTIPHEFRSRWVEMTGDPLQDAIAVVIAWVKRAEAVSEWTWRLEDVDPELLREICSRIDRPISEQRAARAFAAVSRSTNAHRTPDTLPLRWDEIPPSDLKDEVQSIARRFGYL